MKVDKILLGLATGTGALLFTTFGVTNHSYASELQTQSASVLQASLEDDPTTIGDTGEEPETTLDGSLSEYDLDDTKTISNDTLDDDGDIVTGYSYSDEDQLAADEIAADDSIGAVISEQPGDPDGMFLLKHPFGLTIKQSLLQLPQKRMVPMLVANQQMV